MSEYSKGSNGVAHIAGKIDGVTGSKLCHVFTVSMCERARPSGNDFFADFDQVAT